MSAVNNNTPLNSDHLFCPTCTEPFSGTNDEGVDLSVACYDTQDATQRHFHQCCVPHVTESEYTGHADAHIIDHGEISSHQIRLNSRITPVSRALFEFAQAVRAAVKPIFQAVGPTGDNDLDDTFVCADDDPMNPVEVEIQDYAYDAFLTGNTEALTPADAEHPVFITVRERVNALVTQHRAALGRTTPYTWRDVRPTGNEQTLFAFCGGYSGSNLHNTSSTPNVYGGDNDCCEAIDDCCEAIDDCCEGFFGGLASLVSSVFESISEAFTGFFRLIGLAS